MKKRCFLVGAFLLLFASVQTLMADDDANNRPWKKASVEMGAFFTLTTTSVRYGSGVGVSVDLEEALGMNVANSVFRLGGQWRFTNNRRHRLDLSWFSFNRTGDKTINDQIVIEPPGGGENIIIAPGTEVKSKFDLDIYQLGYSYSFIQDDRLDIAAQIGLYIMPISFSLDATGIVGTEGDQDFTTPLPSIGIRLDLLIVPKWYLRTGSQVFYVEYSDYTGSLLNFRSAIEYAPWKHIGIGLGFDVLKLEVSADGDEAVPGMDLRGDLAFGYSGVLLYGRVFF